MRHVVHSTGELAAGVAREAGMGWRAQDAQDAQDARDREERARSRTVPVVERWAWGRLAAIAASVAAVATALYWTA
jgi:hypothetical protein